jgi:hypothetical protein
MYAYPRPYDWAEPGSLQKRAFFLGVYAKAKKIIYPSQLLAEWMESYYPNQEQKRLIIPHQISVDLNTETNDAIQLPGFFDSKKFTILHAGSLMKQRPPFILMKAFNLFLASNQEAKVNSQLIFIGGAFKGHGDEMQSLLNENIAYHYNFLPFEMVFEIQKQATINVVIEANTWLSPFLPGKFPHLVATNKPILHIGPSISETMRLLGENYELHTPNNEKYIDGLAKKVENLYFNWQTGKCLNLDRKDLEEYLKFIEL